MASVKTVTLDFVRSVYPKRHKWSHKGEFGRVLVVGGSMRYKGAPALCGLAALRSGADIVTVAAPESAAATISSFSPDLITEPLVGDYITTDNVGSLIALSKKSDALVIGNGLGRMASTRDAVLELLKALEKPCVLDADSLHLLSGNMGKIRGGCIMTPHEQEFYSVSGTRLSKKLEERIREAKKLSKETNVTVLLKGYKDVIAWKGKAIVNSTGSPYMTVGGTGDVLSGMCGAFLAMGLKPVDSASVAAYLCGEAGSIAARKLGPGLLATDVVEKIPEAMKGIVF